MKTKLIACATASAIAVTGATVTPAKATTDEEIFAFFAGAAALIILANSASSTPAPAPAVVTHSTGPIVVPQTYRFNLDNGTVGGGGNDLWFQAVTPVKMYLKPGNGAKMAVGDRSNRGYNGCKTETFSSHRVSITAMPVGSYVCVKTNAGRISQFRVNGISPGFPKKLKLGYTTWK